MPKRTKSSAMVQLGTAVMATQSAWPGALWHAWEWRVGGCGRAQGQGLGGRHARSPAALPTWPPMVAEWSGVAGVHLGTCEAVRAPQGRNLTTLHAAAAAESREILLRRMPWHLCIKINPAIRLISSSCARPYFGRLYILSEHISLRWTEHFLILFPAIQGWNHPVCECVILEMAQL